MWGECGVFADLPSVVAGATALRTGAIADAVVGVDFFQAVPERADDWNDGDALEILKNCRWATRPNGKLRLIERILKASNQPDPGKFFDLAMLVMGGVRANRSVMHAAEQGPIRLFLTRIAADYARSQLGLDAPADDFAACAAFLWQ
jgi:hypothetical protein